MDVEIRPIREDEFDQASKAIASAFGEHPDPEEMASERLVFEFPRSLAAFEGDDIVGMAGAYTMSLSVPGQAAPMAGVTWVGVRPTHRRRGLLTMLMRRQLDDLADRGEPLAGLWASEGAIYQRFGYGMAAMWALITVDRQWTAFNHPVEPMGWMRLVEKEEALRIMPRVYDRVLPTIPGMLARDERWWKNLFADLERFRHGAGPLLFGVHESGERTDGYVAYSLKFEGHEKGRTLQIKELMAATPEAYVELWRYCLDVDLVGTVDAWNRPPDEPLLHLMAHPYQLKLRVGDSLWLRLVRVDEALAARRYATEDRLVFEVRDAFCPWNEGRYELEGSLDGAACRRTDRDPDLVVDQADLAAAFLGGVGFARLATVGRGLEVTDGALRRADAMFRWHPGPWCPNVF